MRVRPAGRHALLVELDDPEQVQAWYAELCGLRDRGELTAWDRVVEVVPAARTVLLDGLRDPVATARRLSTGGPPAGVRIQEGPLVEVPVHYDGPDLAEVGQLWRLSEQDTVRTHAMTAFVVAFCGFAPGFAYLSGLPSHRHVPRRATPRTRVPAGSVGLAGSYCGIYPGASPGGWQLIGRTDVSLWDIGRDPPALLTPGTRVRFVVAP